MHVAKRKVLIVEDEFLLYEELVDFFEQKGYHVIKQANGAGVDDYETAVELLKHDAPDIAVIDVRIKGNKDGIELAAFIKEHFYSLIIILTAYGDTENLERGRLLGPDEFIIKVGKPLNKTQLWASIFVKLPILATGEMRKRQGLFLRARQIELEDLIRKGKQKDEPDQDPIDKETLIRYETITHIVSHNSKTSGDGNNNLLIHTTDNKGYIIRGAMNEIMDKLPTFFERFNKSTVVNIYKITGKGRRQDVYFVNDLEFTIGDTYKQKVLDKIRLLLGDHF